MLICNPYEIVIQGMTNNNKPFRPSDWAERLCGVLSSFDQGHRLSYHQWVRPILVDNIRCVAVDRKLEQISATAFNFLMDFARDNDLRVLDCKALLEEQQHTQIPLKNAIKQENSTQQTTVTDQPAANTINTALRELTPEEDTTAFPALHRLHTNIRGIGQFQELIQTQRAEGYRLLGIFEEGKQNATTICGFRIQTTLIAGKHLNIEDLSSYHQPIDDNHIYTILNELKKIAHQEHCTCIHANSSVTTDSNNLHHLYLKHGFTLNSHQFIYQLT
jgi:hypothetical protein